MLDELGVKTRWEVISGDAPFFDTTKKIHNALQGRAEDISEAMWRHHFEVNEQNSRTLNLEADVVFIHDPQPAPLIAFRKAGHWIWRRSSLLRWGRLNARKKRKVEGAPVPSRNEEYLIYQTLIGTWPLEASSNPG